MTVALIQNRSLPPRRLVAPLVVGMLLLVYVAVPATAQTPVGYTVRIENVTNGQAFSPPVIVLHGADGDVFEVGQEASDGVRLIAENGRPDLLVRQLESDHRFDHVLVADQPIVAAGTPGAEVFDTVTEYTLTAVEDAIRLSWVSMLMCTNDGFTGLDGIALPTAVGESITVDASGYETHTEINTEDFADMVPPCQALTGGGSDDDGTVLSNPGLAEDGVIALHDGVLGGNDLDPGRHGWTDPVALVTVTALGEVPDDEDPPVTTQQARTVGRLAGATRIDTAVAISQRQFPDGADAVYLARADNTVDAVAAGSLTDGPVLLVPSCDGIPPRVIAEIERLDPAEVIALGGTAAVCDATLQAALG